MEEMIFIIHISSYPSSQFIVKINYNKSSPEYQDQMGANPCCAGLQQDETSRSFLYEFGEDNYEANVEHYESISTRNDAIRLCLKDCEDRLKKSGKLYKDPSLKSQPLILKSSNVVDEFKCTFNRPYQFLKDQFATKGKKYKIFEEGESNSSSIFTKNDALQYFSVFLCFLADHSSLIKEIIITEANTYGICVVNMYIQGVQTPIYIDDYILCHQQRPIFSQPSKGIYMWPCLIEKAWQKVKGYGGKKISITSPIDVFQHFLSYPISVYRLIDLQRSDMKKNIVNKNIGCIVTSKKEPPHKIGLSGRKHFYLKAVIEFQGRTLYYLRNPCGIFDFRGFNRSISPDLFAKIKAETYETVIADGNFILEEDEFLQQIEELLIVHFNKNSSVVTEKVISLAPNQEFYVEFVLERQEQISISFVQDELQGDFPYFPVTYQVISEENGHYKIISGQNNEQGCFGVRSTSLLQNTYQRLQPGTYLIRLKKKFPTPALRVPLKSDSSNKIVITASRSVQINFSLPQLYRNKFYEFLKQHGKTQMGRISSGSRYRGPQIDYGTIWLGDIVYVLLRKTNPSKTKINLQVSFPNKINLECINHNLKNEYTAIPLNQEDLLIILEKIVLTQETSLGKYFIETF